MEESTGNDPRGEVTLQEIADFEMREIAERRRKACLDGDLDVIKNGRVGLALSGGGVRSAAFNLGVIQAFDSRGMLREIDYLSTVSGGGYAGSFLSAMGAAPAAVADCNAPPPDRAVRRGIAPAGAGGDDLDRGGLSILPRAPGGLGEDVGKQPTAIQALIHGSNYLVRPVSFLNDWLSGWILVNVTVLSLLVAGLALLAALFRMLDHRDTIDFFYALGFRSDVSRAFVPALVAFMIWAVAWLWQLARARDAAQRAEHRFTDRLFLAVAVLAAIAVAALLGTGDIYLPFWSASAERPEELGRWIDGVKSALKLTLILALVLTLAPYLRPASLIRSGSRPRSRYERWVFKLASYGLFLGVPLFLFALLAKENISGWNAKRSDVGDITPIHILDGVSWHRFLGRIKAEAEKYHPADPATNAYYFSYILWNHLNSETSEVPGTSLPEAIIRDDSLREQWNRTLWLPQRVWNFRDIWNTQCRLLEHQQQVAGTLNHTYLRKPDFCKWFAVAEAPTEPRAVLFKGRREAAELAGKAFPPPGSEPDPTKPWSEWAARESRLANFRLLQAYYGEDTIRAPETVFAYVVTIGPKYRFPFFVEGDQAWRLNIFWISALVFILAGFFVKVNFTSVHGFYRDQLAKVWLRSGLQMAGATAAHDTNIPLTSLGTNRIPSPYHLINCTVNFFARSAEARSSGDADLKVADPIDEERTAPRSVPATGPFLFSKGFCGCVELGYARTGQYMAGQYDLANAMAVSGAAVSPVVFANPFVVAILVALNFRLGQWLPNPARRSADGNRLDWLWSRRRPIPLALDCWQHPEPKDRRYCFVTDGGHYDNLGLESLLERRCYLIIVSDAGADPQGRCDELLKALSRCAMDKGIRVVQGSGKDRQLRLGCLAPNPRNRVTRRHYVVARILYPPLGPNDMPGPDEGFLVYLKASLNGDEGDSELARHAEPCSEFPHDSTVDQFYDPSQFEAYRQLGFHIAAELCDEIRPSTGRQPLLSEWNPFASPPGKGCDQDTAAPTAACGVAPLSACPFGNGNGNSRRHSRSKKPAK